MNAKSNAGIVILVVAVLSLAGLFLYQEFFPGETGYGYGYGRHMMGGWGMGGLSLVFWGLILFGLILMINWLLTANRNEERGSCPDTPLEILKRRYAGGEIDRGQYEQMRKELSS